MTNTTHEALRKALEECADLMLANGLDECDAYDNARAALSAAPASEQQSKFVRYEALSEASQQVRSEMDALKNQFVNDRSEQSKSEEVK